MKPERIQSPAVACILGVTKKTVSEMASRGELPSAARIGRRWTFNEEEIRKWVRHQEQVAQTRALNASSWHQRKPNDIPKPPWIIDEEYERELGLNRPGVVRYRERMARKKAASGER